MQTQCSVQTIILNRDTLVTITADFFRIILLHHRITETADPITVIKPKALPQFLRYLRYEKLLRRTLVYVGPNLIPENNTNSYMEIQPHN